MVILSGFEFLTFGGVFLGVKMSQEKNSKKKLIIVRNFCFPVDLIRPTGPMITMVTRYTGGLSQLLLVKMSWDKNSKEKPLI